MKTNLPIARLSCIAAALLFAAGLQAAAVQPCSAGANNETILPIKNSVQAYCVSGFGWSDTWFFSNPGSYDGNKDVLSGDDSPFIRYTVGPGNTAGNGDGFLSPSLDMGTMNPQNINSNWSIIQNLSYTHGSDTASSTIQDANDGLVIAIMTQVIGSQVFLHFAFTNNGAQAINNLRFGDYWNFHPNGSKSGTTENQQGTTVYSPTTGIVTTTGNQAQPTFIADGRVFGQRAPDVHQIGTVSNILTAISQRLSE